MNELKIGASPSKIGQGAKIADIEFLRGLAIIFTLIAHSFFLFPEFSWLMIFTSKRWFGSGVDLFFVISGFVITTSLSGSLSSLWDKRKDIATVDDRWAGSPAARILMAFWVRRAFRLFPGALAAIILTLIFVAAFSPRTPGFPLGDLLLHMEGAGAAVLQVFNIWCWRQVATTGQLTLLGAYWSLSLEEQFYLVFPIVVLACGSLRRVGYLSLAIIFVMFFVRKSMPHDAMWWFRVDGLFWGVAIAAFRPRLKFLEGIDGPAKLAASLIVLVVCSLGLSETTTTMAAYNSANGILQLFAAALVLVASQNRNMFALPIAGPIFIYLGERSYSIYLFHILILTAAYNLGDALQQWSALPTWTIALVKCLLVLAGIFAIDVFYKAIETRFRNAGRNLSARILAGEPPRPFLAAPKTKSLE